MVFIEVNDVNSPPEKVSDNDDRPVGKKDAKGKGRSHAPGPVHVGKSKFTILLCAQSIMLPEEVNIAKHRRVRAGASQDENDDSDNDDSEEETAVRQGSGSKSRHSRMGTVSDHSEDDEDDSIVNARQPSLKSNVAKNRTTAKSSSAMSKKAGKGSRKGMCILITLGCKPLVLMLFLGRDQYSDSEDEVDDNVRPTTRSTSSPETIRKAKPSRKTVAKPKDSKAAMNNGENYIQRTCE